VLGNVVVEVDGVILVCKISCIIFLTISLCLSSGCTLLESLTTNVGGWDVSACVTGFDTCWELFTDNSEKFEDGFVAALDSLVVE
jgi:hypothetical protein